MVHQQSGGYLKALATHLSATGIKTLCLKTVRYLDQRRGGGRFAKHSCRTHAIHTRLVAAYHGPDAQGYTLFICLSAD